MSASEATKANSWKPDSIHNNLLRDIVTGQACFLFVVLKIALTMDKLMMENFVGSRWEIRLPEHFYGDISAAGREKEENR